MANFQGLGVQSYVLTRTKLILGIKVYIHCIAKTWSYSFVSIVFLVMFWPFETMALYKTGWDGSCGCTVGLPSPRPKREMDRISIPQSIQRTLTKNNKHKNNFTGLQVHGLVWNSYLNTWVCSEVKHVCQRSTLVFINVTKSSRNARSLTILEAAQKAESESLTLQEQRDLS